MPLSPGLIDTETVNAALEQVMRSARLRSAVQLRRFLAFVVEESLVGRGDKLKAYTIATRALGRSSDFDPGKDPIVRVEATRLRAALTAYYAEEGRESLIRIHMLPGSYRPLIELRDSPGIAAVDVTADVQPADEPAPASAAATTARSSRLVLGIAVAALAWSVVSSAVVGYGLYALNHHTATLHGGAGNGQQVSATEPAAAGAPAAAGR
ncbi:adenylate cyclase [Blastochloris viridis]|uniref:Adenylate cyclase n=1 Tax=Blastochloris viridis TaxID=1079 RepID=A0A182CZ86_BLAVI|nr:adenylate cyclase [Blastochloris viridis]